MSWVTGPHELSSRSFTVQVGTRVVLLVDGRPHPVVYTPGRAGGVVHTFDDRRVPIFGELRTLVFTSAADVTTRARADVRLADGARVMVNAVLEVVPAWTDSDSLLLSWVERFGANPTAIENAARHALDADFLAIVNASIGGLDHDRVHSANDNRGLFRLDVKPTGLLRIDRLHSVEISEDADSRAAENTRRSATVVAQSEAEADHIRAMLDHKLALLRQDHVGELQLRRVDSEITSERMRALATVDINTAIAAAYGMSPAEVAYPGAFAERQRVIGQTIRSVLTDNADVLPIIAELGDSDPVGFLTQMFSPTSRSLPEPLRPPRTSVRSWPLDPAASPLLRDAGLGEPLVGSVVLTQPSRTHVVAVVGRGGDRIVGAINDPERVHALVVQQRDSTPMTIVALLGLMETWAGARFDFAPLRVEESGLGRMVIDIDRVDFAPGDATTEAGLSIAGWVVALNDLAASGEPAVEVRVGGRS